MASVHAKEHSLDIPHVSCIEFPLKIKSIDKALSMVGGRSQITRSIHDEDNNPLELRFTNNIHEHPVTAKCSSNEQILVKISVPKKLLEENGGNIHRTLHDVHQSEKKPVHVTPIAIINKSFRFREMSDFQYQTANSQFAQKIDSAIHSLRYDEITNLDVYSQDTEPWEYDIPEKRLFDLPPPPRFSSIPLPFNFNYKKNAATITKEGKITTKNRHIKLNSIIIKWSDKPPVGPSRELINQLTIFKAQQNENQFFKDIVETIGILEQLFRKKPIWIRKHLEALLPPPLKLCLKYALPQIAYTYTKGPWRQAYIRFGIDPKSSSEYSIYQTEGFRVPHYSKRLPKDFVSETANSVSKVFKFDGETLPFSLLFQLENITDSLIRGVLQKAEMRETVDFTDGWLDRLSMIKVRRLMRYKLRSLVDGAILDPNKIDYILHKLQLHEADEQDTKTDEHDEEADEDIEEDEEDLEDDYELDINEADYPQVMQYLEKFNPRGATELGRLSGLIKQTHLALD